MQSHTKLYKEISKYTKRDYTWQCVDGTIWHMGIKVFNPAQCLKLRGTAGLTFDLGCSIDGSDPSFLLKVGFRFKVIDRRIMKFPARVPAQNAEAPGANQEKDGICKSHKFIHAYKPFQWISENSTYR